MRFSFVLNSVLLFAVNSSASNNIIWCFSNCFNSLCSGQQQPARAFRVLWQIRGPTRVEYRYDCEDKPIDEHISTSNRIKLQ